MLAASSSHHDPSGIALALQLNSRRSKFCFSSIHKKPGAVSRDSQQAPASPLVRVTARNGLVLLDDSGSARFGQRSRATAEAHFQSNWRHRKCKVFPHGFRTAHPFYVEIFVKHREQ
jgi:hypothetical protein